MVFINSSPDLLIIVSKQLKANPCLGQKTNSVDELV